MKELLNVVVVGYGHLGKWHCQKVEATGMAKLHAIVELNPTAQNAARTAHPNAKVVSSLDEVLKEADAFFIVTPTSFHFETAKKVLEAGKHCFCEKPMTSTPDQSRELIQLATKADVILQAGHSERCHLVWDRLNTHFQAIDTPFQLKINRYAPFKGRATDVDVVQDLMIHDIDLMLYLFSQKPTSVKAWGTKMRSNHWDHVTAVFNYPNGGNACITVGRGHVREVRELDLITEKGCWLVDLFHSQVMDNQVSNNQTELFEYQKCDHLLVEHQAFYQSILHGQKVLVSGQDGLAAVQLVQIVLDSISTGKEISFSIGEK